jgi:hypothetical protein
VAGVAEGVAGAIVGLGVAGLSVRDGVEEGVGDEDGEPVGDGRFAAGVPEAVALGLAAGAAHAATKARTRSATTDWRRNMSCPPEGRFTHPQDRHPAIR